MNLTTGLTLIAAYARARWARRLSRVNLERLQQKWLRRLLDHAALHSAFYAPHARLAWKEWPIIGKSEWMRHFDAINTVGARLVDVSAIAVRAERTRNFAEPWGRFSVGLSTGTSGSRGVFLVSLQEQARWAGTLMGLLLRNGIFARERIALVLRSGGSLYESMGALRLRFRFFDQSQPWGPLVESLQAYRPTILVAPPSALRMLGKCEPGLNPGRVISVAEVLDPLDRGRIEECFGVPVEQIYQATEGLLGFSCEHGTVHLNEPYMLIEQEWLDRERTRFIPIVTDLWRRSQPVIRYRLDDVLHVARDPCRCGRASLALSAIEGRCNDVLWLPGEDDMTPIFPDVVSRAIVMKFPQLEDYRLIERAIGQWCIRLRPLPAAAEQEQLIGELQALAARLQAAAPQIEIEELEVAPLMAKQRRILGAGPMPCAS